MPGCYSGPCAALGDRHSLAAAAAWPANAEPGRSLRVLYVDQLNAVPVDSEITSSCGDAAIHLRNLGHTVERGALPLDLDRIHNAWSSVGQIGLAALFAHYPRWQEGASAKYLAMAEQGAAVTAPGLWALLSHVERLREDCARLFDAWDVVAMPSAAALPWAGEQAFPVEIAGQPVGPRGSTTGRSRYPRPFPAGRLSPPRCRAGRTARRPPGPTPAGGKGAWVSNASRVGPPDFQCRGGPSANQPKWRATRAWTR